MSPSTTAEYRLSELQRHLDDVVDMYADSKDRLIELEEAYSRLFQERTQQDKAMLAMRKEMEEIANSIGQTNIKPITELTQRVEKVEKETSLVSHWMKGLQNMLRTRLAEHREAANG